MTGPAAYKTTSPQALDAWDRGHAALTAYADQVATVLEEHGAGRYERWFDNRAKPGLFLGLQPSGAVPEGWRRELITGWWVPDARKQQGRAVRNALTRIRWPGGPGSNVPGMAAEAMFPLPKVTVGTTVPGWGMEYLPCVMERHGNVLYALWDQPLRTSQYDGELWQECPVSEFCHARESDTPPATPRSEDHQ